MTVNHQLSPSINYLQSNRLAYYELPGDKITADSDRFDSEMLDGIILVDNT